MHRSQWTVNIGKPFFEHQAEQRERVAEPFAARLRIERTRETLPAITGRDAEHDDAGELIDGGRRLGDMQRMAQWKHDTPWLRRWCVVAASIPK
jgi:hypothetical protein